MLAIDLVGKQFGRLTVVKRAGANPWNRRALWSCLCVCGNQVIASGIHLRHGMVKSCGCLRSEGVIQRNITLGKQPKRSETSHPLYVTWRNIKLRCLNKQDEQYGGRGIGMCLKWQESFAAFLADLGERPNEEMSLDRYPDPDGNYEPGNVRWATRQQQRDNRSKLCV